jgi:hypothetical protein
MRCVGFADCGKLVTPGQPCGTCVAPRLFIKPGAVVGAKAGHVTSLPIILANESPAGRPLWVKRIARVDGNGESLLSIPFDRVDAQSENEFLLDTTLKGGAYTLSMRLVLATRYKNVEEEYAFAAGVAVSATDGPNINLHVAGDTSGSGAGGHNVNVNAGTFDRDTRTVISSRTALPLQRAERYEVEQGIRGYRHDGLRVLRTVDFAFSGFRPEDTPGEEAAMLARGRLLVGRNSRPPVPAGTTANDVCLRVFDARTKKPDEAATMAISRHHFDFVAVNDQLAIQVRASGGMQVNDKELAAGELYPVAHGDRIIPIPGRGDKLTLRVAFTNGIDVVNRIVITRTPPVPKRA